MRHRPLAHTLGALLLSAVGLASAQDAFTSRPMNLRAGPNRDYPLVAQLDEGAPLEVHGCLSDWSWCDVSFEDTRGWIYAGGVSFVYQGERVPLYSYGPSLGLPIITFSLLPYWGHYYRGRPWYPQRDDWDHRRMPPHMRPRGRPYAGPPPMPHGRPPAGGGPERRGEAPMHTAPMGHPQGGRPQMQPQGGRPQMQPQGGRPQMQERRPPSGGAAQNRNGQQGGRAAPPGRTAPPQKRERGERPPGHPPGG
jgi:uncharacterized protein YraI